MKVGNWLLMALVLVPIAIVLVRDARADDDESQEQDKLKKLIEESIDWYQLFPETGSQAPMRSQTVLRWINASRGQKGEDILVIWIHDGQPQAAASIFPSQGDLCHQFASLSRDSRLIAKDGKAIVWTPSAAGAEFHDVPNAPMPAGTASARLIQIKSLAERFTATMTGLKFDNSDREQLRLLPRPVYRYELKEDKSSHANLQDGAVFAFVQGTDPEVLLLLEAVRQERWCWQYSFARATSGGLEVRLDGQLVWSAEKSFGNRPPTSPQITLRRMIMK